MLTVLDRKAAESSVSGMSRPPDNHDLARQLAVLEERYDKGWALLREDMAKRETRMLLAIAAMIGLGIAVLDFIG